jgi:ribonucleoside-diphosphate reductase alpha chain
MTIKIDLTRDSLFDSLGLQRLRESYMMEEETSPQERFALCITSFLKLILNMLSGLYEYSSKHWLSYSTPILSFGRSKRGLPI